MRHAVATTSTRDVLLGQVFEECCLRKSNQVAATPAPVSMKLMTKLRIDRLLEELEIEYDSKV